MGEKSGWERSRRTHFDEIVETYDRIRPEYPKALYDDIFKYMGENNSKNAVEIGAGTGKATLPFLENEYKVTAVELGKNMAEFLHERYKGRDNFSVVVNSFEDAKLEQNSYDLIYAASAFHWVDAEVGCPKVYRLLKEKGVFALFRYNAPIYYGESYSDIEKVYDKYYYSYYDTAKKPLKISDDDFKKPSEIYRAFRFYDLKDYRFSDITMKLYKESITYSADEYQKMLETFSDHRALPAKNREALLKGVKNAINMHGGTHTIDYVFQLYMGRK